MRLIKGFELFNFSSDCPLDLNNFNDFLLAVNVTVSCNV